MRGICGTVTVTAHIIAIIALAIVAPRIVFVRAFATVAAIAIDRREVSDGHGWRGRRRHMNDSHLTNVTTVTIIAANLVLSVRVTQQRRQKTQLGLSRSVTAAPAIEQRPSGRNSRGHAVDVGTCHRAGTRP